MASGTQDARAPASRRFVAPFVGVLLCALAAGSLSGDPASIPHAPLLFGALVAIKLFLDAVRLDVFERAKFTPTLPALALAFTFGPAGAIAGEVIGTFLRVRGAPAVRWLFDLGSLGLSGVAAAWIYAAVPHDTPALVVAAATGAGLVYYVVNIALLSTVLSLNEGAAPALVFRERFAWMWWHYALHGTMAGLLVVAYGRVGAM